MELIELQVQMRKIASPKRARISMRFFKTEKGEYGEGDYFLGITVPKLRKIAKKAENLELKFIRKLLYSKWHEERFVAIVILVNQFLKDPCEKKVLFDFYLKHAKQINNWDMVDVSADKIVGKYSFHYMKTSEAKALLINLSSSQNLWKRRIAILTCLYHIRQNDFKFIIMLAKRLLNDDHDLIHKSLGWMLREVGKRDKKLLVQFLNKHKQKMPRTMLRYAIEKFTEKERRKILAIR